MPIKFIGIKSYKDLPKQIQEHYSTSLDNIQQIRLVPSTKGGTEGYNVTLLALGAIEKWRFIGELGSRKWVIIK